MHFYIPALVVSSLAICLVNATDCGTGNVFGNQLSSFKSTNQNQRITSSGHNQVQTGTTQSFSTLNKSKKLSSRAISSVLGSHLDQRDFYLLSPPGVKTEVVTCHPSKKNFESGIYLDFGFAFVTLNLATHVGHETFNNCGKRVMVYDVNGHEYATYPVIGFMKRGDCSFGYVNPRIPDGFTIKFNTLE